MFEKFLWQPKHMRDCSLHYSYLSADYAKAWKAGNPGKNKPPRQLDEETISRLVAKRNDGLVSRTLANIAIAKFDMAIYLYAEKQ